MSSATKPSYETVDFKALAQQDEAFNTIWQQHSGRLDFQDPDTTKTLTKALLKVDFSLQLEVPDDRLCPPVPNRWNYVCWIHTLLDSTNPSYSSHYDPERQVIGLDIGTGASAIYTMLCLKSRPAWTMCATDVDKKSFESAARNLTINNLITRAKLLQTIDSQPLIPLQYLGVDKLDFTICNPPFFADEMDMRQSLSGEGKSVRPNAVCTGSENEMVCRGGDLGFVTRIVDESLTLRERVTWYTSMFGKMSSAKAIIGLLKEKSVTNWAVGSIDVGGGTKRWIVAWSFADYRPPNSIARIEKFANEYLPFPTEYRFSLPANTDTNAAKHTIDRQARRLHIRWNWDSQSATGVGEAAENVWSRAYRRKHERRMRELAATDARDAEMHTILEDMEVALAFRIAVAENTREVIIEWLRGSDQVLWESFCGMVHRSFKKS
ncbi:uncharacterized protein CC84DRAFT_273337 [Paraphaeosphaeria sporulosa]|uniref:U6 small nuclear RNA (adenine-(43)-N(6))-methyltransferase n=1 Tax=Paraphaeosphaeria sporulosa TaxID=1460663 RepID=A0A177BZY4_9PLEO|nr:uncharacterized protein CC84DRAFT_273337 [Paraphaeosphaeria sporulosa]OAG00943.1 hypothetical protein CC84DRAFT_273337 [Paraphaeosphaeria sporulosa]